MPSEVYYQLFLPDDDQPHGYLLPETVQKMPWTPRFHVNHNSPGRSVTVLDSSNGTDPAGAVNLAFQELIDECIEQDLFHVIAGKHSEPFSIVSAKHPIHLERFASALFGITGRGAYIIAYTSDHDDGSTTKKKKMKLWIPRRAAHLYTGPGKLDVTVAGGIKAGSTPLETMVHEADEEASLPEALVRERVRPAGALTYINATSSAADGFPGEKGLVVPLVIYTHDLELPPDVIPTPNDDEVDEFYLMTVEEVQTALLRGEFKADSAAALVDFLVRHGVLNAQNEKDLVEICMRLHRRLPFRLP